MRVIIFKEYSDVNFLCTALSLPYSMNVLLWFRNISLFKIVSLLQPCCGHFFAVKHMTPDLLSCYASFNRKGT